MCRQPASRPPGSPAPRRAAWACPHCRGATAAVTSAERSCRHPPEPRPRPLAASPRVDVGALEPCLAARNVLLEVDFPRRHRLVQCPQRGARVLGRLARVHPPIIGKSRRRRQIWRQQLRQRAQPVLVARDDRGQRLPGLPSRSPAHRDCVVHLLPPVWIVISRSNRAASRASRARAAAEAARYASALVTCPTPSKASVTIRSA